MLPPYSILSTSPITITPIETKKVGETLEFLIQRNQAGQASLYPHYYQALIADFSWCYFLPAWSILVSIASKIFLKDYFDCVIPLTRSLW